MEEQATYEIATRQETTPAMLLNLAIDKGADIDKLERLMDLQIKWEANKARKAYHAAMAAFKANAPEIEKDKKVSFKHKNDPGKTEYRHATLSNVTDKINSALSDNGLTASWLTEQSDRGVTVTCKITHVDGHSEQTSLTAGLDLSGQKNAIQAIGSTISYLERYTILALTGLATRDMDDDGATVPEFITEEQADQILKQIEAKGVDAAAFLTYMGVETIGKIGANDFNKAMQALKMAKGKKAKDADNS